MAELMLFSETGMFHSGVRCTWGSVVEWYGFLPERHRSPAGRGKVDRSDRSALINHSARFRIDDLVLRKAVDATAADYATKTYVVTVVDCVSFTADVARKAGLKVPLVNFTPYGFLKTVESLNPSAVIR
ncbi:hypothetical protein TA3x_000047 [Tundrisphaera sp. TA3]|uniref:hypothetical protein n=1 Tax=Tundrisphaera sp. TA3 TaxID=3435775 RepID=UPI003EB8FC1F